MIPKLDWKFTQVFGDKGTCAQVADEDVISAMAFDTTGSYLSLGDKAGRLIIFQRSFSKNKKGVTEYQYFWTHRLIKNEELPDGFLDLVGGKEVSYNDS